MHRRPFCSRRLVVFLSLLPVFLLLAGCATSTIESRKKERYGAYSSLPPETRQLVDEGRIKVGMPMDAVYIAWGPPSQVLSGETEAGQTTTWLYSGNTLQEVRYWSYRPVFYGNIYYQEPYLQYDYFPQRYTKAEVVFQNGVVKSWHMLNQPNP